MTMKTLIAMLATLLALVLPPAGAAELRVLSAGAVEPGLRPALAAFEQTSGHRVQLTFATAPQIRERGKSGGFDLVIAPSAVLDELEAAMQIDADHALRVSLGRVGLGAIAEILLAHDQGLRFVGPLPPDLQNYTMYVAAAARGAAGSDSAEAARALLRHLAGEPSQATFARAGIEHRR